MNQDLVYITVADTSFLYILYQWGIDLIKHIQSIETPSLTVFIQSITKMGSGYFYMLVVPLVLWCIDEKKGLHLGLLVILSGWINGVCKNLLKQPRPYNLNPSVGRGFEPSYGLPSGHAQFALNFWIPLASWIGAVPQYSTRAKRLIWLCAFLMVLLMSFTRIYLGLHFPTDILGGWVVGGAILAMYFLLARPVEAALAARGTRVQMLSAALIALGMNTLGIERNLGGLFLGFSLGYSLMLKHFPFSAHSEINGKRPGIIMLGIRYILGMIGTALIYVGLWMILPGGSSLFAEIPVWGSSSPYRELSRFIHHGAVGVWISCGAPWLFLRLGLASTSKA
jgi:membrane-associated phospholipid phosphatase